MQNRLLFRRIVISAFVLLFISGCGHFRRKKPIPATTASTHETPTRAFKKTTPKEDAAMFQEIGLAYFQQKDLRASSIFLSKAVQLNPKLYLSWYCLGLLNVNSPQGYDYLKKAAQEKPEFPNPYYWMAYYHCRLGEDRKAISLFKEYIKLAKGKFGEEERVRAAKEVLQELESGKEGKFLTEIRKSAQ